MFAIEAIFIIYFALITVLDSPRVRSRDWTSRTGQVYFTDVCAQGDFGAVYVCLIVVEGLLLCAGVAVSFSTRHVHDAFAEARFISLAIYNIFLCALATIPVVWFLRPSPDAGHIFKIAALLIGTNGTLALLFVPKIRAINKHTEVTAGDFFRERSSTKSPTSSTSVNSSSSAGSKFNTTSMRFSHEQHEQPQRWSVRNMSFYPEKRASKKNSGADELQLNAGVELFATAQPPPAPPSCGTRLSNL